MIKIVEYADEHHSAFHRINLEWLDAYQLTESHDLEVLDNPRGNVIDRGGFIWVALAGTEVIGSSAILKTDGEGEFELAKMTVVPEYRGKGISHLLINACIDKAKQIGARKIILFSNHKLTTALKLYEKVGFRHTEVKDSPFLTADIRMEMIL